MTKRTPALTPSELVHSRSGLLCEYEASAARALQEWGALVISGNTTIRALHKRCESAGVKMSCTITAEGYDVRLVRARKDETASTLAWGRSQLLHEAIAIAFDELVRAT